MRIGVDTGGTFTDVVALDRQGALRVTKLPSTPRDPAEAVLGGVRAAAGEFAVEEVVHSTTVATNALLERTRPPLGPRREQAGPEAPPLGPRREEAGPEAPPLGPRREEGGPEAPPVVLVTTAGFEDVLEIGRQARPSLYALHPVKPEPLVPASHRLGARERLEPDGSVRLALDEAEVRELVARVRALSPRAIAICLLHAYANPAHERLLEDALAELGVPISRSSEVLPVLREYERTSTTVVDAYVRPLMAGYLERLERELAPSRLRVMQSNGGVLAAGEAARHPVRTLLSGPAAGVVGALAIARACEAHRVLTLDMGGTSTDCALIDGGALALAEEAEVGGCPIQLPMLAVHTVGAGGGSIARVDAGGALKVGPDSAGADPGPACYGKGGLLPTVTDADLVLGRLDPERFLGGGLTLDRARARAAVGAIAERLGKPLEAAAEDIVAVADAVMARAIKRISVDRGHDPAGFSLMPFGGAGAMHAWAVARELGIARVIVPPQPGLLCAWGALAADVVHERVHTLLTVAGERLPARALAVELDRLQADAERALDADGVAASRRAVERTAGLRYRGQSFELPVPIDDEALDLVEAFHAAHRARYGYALPHAVELVTLRVRAIGRVATPPLPSEPLDEGEPEIGRATAVFAGRAYGASLWLRRRLRPDGRVRGPGLILEYSATTVVPPEVEARVLPSGALELTAAV